MKFFRRSKKQVTHAELESLFLDYQAAYKAWAKRPSDAKYASLASNIEDHVAWNRLSKAQAEFEAKRDIYIETKGLEHVLRHGVGK